MFAKAVFFFALVTFVNAAPIIDYTINPGVRPIKVTLPAQPVVAVDLKREPSLDASADIAPSLSKVAPVVLPDFAHIIAVPYPKRETVEDIDALGDQIINGLKSNGLDVYIEHLSTRIQRLKDILASDVSHAQIPAETSNLLLEYRQILAGLDVNKAVMARDIVINGQILVQLQNFVDNTVNLLRTLGKFDAVNNFLSEVNRLKTEAQNGTLDAGDLLEAARDIVLSVL